MQGPPQKDIDFVLRTRLYWIYIIQYNYIYIYTKKTYIYMGIYISTHLYIDPIH